MYFSYVLFCICCQIVATTPMILWDNNNNKNYQRNRLRYKESMILHMKYFNVYRMYLDVSFCLCLSKTPPSVHSSDYVSYKTCHWQTHPQIETVCLCVFGSNICSVSSLLNIWLSSFACQCFYLRGWNNFNVCHFSFPAFNATKLWHNKQ